ncbi:MAG: cellulase family glycosylhydrolase [Bacteroidetes bacterium]|nr:cellulase family glycosylhydrolase [Fibrella sp.]
MKKVTLALLLLLPSAGLWAQAPVAPTTQAAQPVLIAGRWSAEKANAWYAKQPWFVGANFIPSTAINQLEMWQAETFDPTTIDKELGLAEGLGMNMMRVFLHNLVWEKDPEGYKQRIGQFLQIADKHHIKIMFVLFDSCWNDDPKLGKQPDPKPGVHNSGWARAPGTKRLFDARTWPGLQTYVTGVLRAFANDGRVVVWDLFNEPTNSGYNDAVMPLLTKSFEWARAANPSQPITAGWWHDHPLSGDFMFANSDIITFHNYNSADKLEQQIVALQKMGRPILCTEYMARRNNSLFETCLPVLKKYKVGAINWGLVKGKTNTIFAWDTPIAGGEEPPLWFHDIFRPDGSVFDPKEIAVIKRETGVVK